MVELETMSLRRGQFRILLVTAMGQFLASAVATLCGIAIAMIESSRIFELSALEQGVIASAVMFGITIGALIIGKLSHEQGDLLYLRLSSLIVCLSAAALACFPNRFTLILCLFAMGFGCGGDYDLDPDYISETMPTKWRQRMVGLAKAFSAVGNIFIALSCVLLLLAGVDDSRWNLPFWIISLIALLMFVSRIFFIQNPAFLIEKGQKALAQKEVDELLGNDVRLDDNVPEEQTKHGSWLEFLEGKNLKRVIFSGLPWACSGFGVYGIGIFIPILLLKLGVVNFGESSFDHLLGSIKLTALVSVFMLVGLLLGLWLLSRLSAVFLQVWGFFGAGLSIFVLLLSYNLGWNHWIAISSLALFELFLNAGPNLVTFIIPSLIYPVDERSEGAGIATAIGKIGAIVAVFSFPILMHATGMTTTLTIATVTFLLGAFITMHYSKALGIK